VLREREFTMRLVLASAILVGASLIAYAAPPEGSKLSEIIAKVEQTADLHYIDEIDWSERGYYEIEYFLKNGTKVEVKIDPKTGNIVK
jgi:hypothetical protein